MHLISPATSSLILAQPIFASSLPQPSASVSPQADNTAAIQSLVEPDSVSSGVTRLFSEPRVQRLRRSALAAIPAFIIGGLMVLFGSGCFLDRSGLASAPRDGGPGDGGPDSGPFVDAGPDADVDSGPEDAGDAGDGGVTYPADHIPAQSLPIDRQVLAPTRAFLSWRDGVIPSGATARYRTCYATDAADLDEAGECPNETIETNPFRVIDPLAPMQSYFWKVRTCYDDAGTDCTEYSPIRSFSTDNSLVGWWRMDDGDGAVARDSSSAGNDGSLMNFSLPAAWVPGIVGSALRFDGSNDFIDIGSFYDFNSSDAFTLETWAHRTSGGSVQSLLSHIDFTSALTREGYRLSFTASDQLKIQLRSNDSTGDLIELDTIPTFPAIPAGPLQSITMTYDGSSLAAGVTIYADGSSIPLSVITDNLTGSILSAAPTWIGAQVDTDFTTPDRAFDGDIDEVAIYNRVLTPPIITNNYCGILALAGVLPLPSQCN